MDNEKFARALERLLTQLETELDGHDNLATEMLLGAVAFHTQYALCDMVGNARVLQLMEAAAEASTEPLLKVRRKRKAAQA